jgi:catechol 2,3-dioxygenase-like lactoylglutathione lyase family enzyme
MLHHLSFAVLDLQRAATFYDAALGALGYVRVWSAADAVGYGLEEGEDKFAIKAAKEVQAPSPGFHLAFEAGSRKAVDDFYRAALEHGGSDNGAPGLRPQYGPSYYAAFVRDPDGYRIEAVFISRVAAR